MAKKTSNNDLLGVLSFAVVILNAVIWALNLLKVNTGSASYIAGLLLLIVVLWTGWTYAQKLSNTMRVVYGIIAIVAIVLQIFGWI